MFVVQSCDYLFHAEVHVYLLSQSLRDGFLMCAALLVKFVCQCYLQ